MSQTPAGTSRTSTADRIAAVLRDAVVELNRQLPPAARLGQSPDTVLTGTGAGLDSLGLINFIVLAEEKLEEAFGKRISLTDGDAIGERADTFSTLGALADYVSGVLDGAA